jgi:hypothetical protein
VSEKYRAVMALLVAVVIQTSTVAGVPAATAMAPESVTFTALGGVRIALREADTSTKRLVFDVQGDDVTRVPQDVPIRFAFNTPITRVSLPEAPTRIRVDTMVVDRTATFFLARDPFSPPLGWRYTVVIEVETFPDSGQLTIGATETQEVFFHLPPTAVPATTSRSST